MWSVPSGSERRILRRFSSVACGIFGSGPLVRTSIIIVLILMTRCIWLSHPGNGDKVNRIEKAGLLPRFFLDIIEINDILDINYITYIKYINEIKRRGEL